MISDEVYAHLAFGSTPFVPMGAFGSVVPVLTLGSISKRWIVPGWRIGWLVVADPNGILHKSGVWLTLSLSLSLSLWNNYNIVGNKINDIIYLFLNNILVLMLLAFFVGY